MKSSLDRGSSKFEKSEEEVSKFKRNQEESCNVKNRTKEEEQ